MFLDEWLGRWPPASDRDVIACALRDGPAWNGKLQPVVAVGDADGRWVVSVAPSRNGSLEPRAGETTSDIVFRWCEVPAPLEPLGEWVAGDDPVLPAWLRPFGGEALIVTDDEGYLAGVGLKRHLDSGWEIAVGTEPRGRGKGLARRLVATAAARVLDEGRAVVYLHDDDNVASAKAAEGAGFPDLGWRSMAVFEQDEEEGD